MNLEVMVRTNPDLSTQIHQRGVVATVSRSPQAGAPKMAFSQFSTCMSKDILSPYPVHYGVCYFREPYPFEANISPY